jgi:hypothetical protein
VSTKSSNFNVNFFNQFLKKEQTMKKLSHIATALANNTLSERTMSHIKGGLDTQNTLVAALSSVTNIVEDEKRRERPGGGINTN